MKLLIQDKNRKGVSWIFQILLQSLYEDLHPIIISGETGFPFLYFLDYSRRFNIPFSVTSKVLSGSAVNMHHVSDFLKQVKRLDNSHFPIFVDYSRHFLDENVNDWSCKSIFWRNKKELEVISKMGKPLLFYESGRGRSTNRHPFFRDELVDFSNVSVYIDCDSFSISKNELGFLGDEFNGESANLKVLNVCSSLIPDLGRYGKVHYTRRKEVFRRWKGDVI